MTAMGRADAAAVQTLLQAVRGVALPRQAENASRYLARRSFDVLGEGMNAADVIEHVDRPHQPPTVQAIDPEGEPQDEDRAQPVRTSRKARKNRRKGSRR